MDLSLFPTYKKCMVKEMVINYSIHISYRFYGRRENRGSDTGPASLLYVIWIGNSAVWTCCCWCCDSEHSFVLLLLWFRQCFSAAVRLFTFLRSSIVHQKYQIWKDFFNWIFCLRECNKSICWYIFLKRGRIEFYDDVNFNRKSPFKNLFS